MKSLISVTAIALALTACASTEPKAAMLEKYPKCYHANNKIANACIKKNEAGEDVSALTLENQAYPGQYK